jgi:hypothetical protein
MLVLLSLLGCREELGELRKPPPSELIEGLGPDTQGPDTTSEPTTTGSPSGTTSGTTSGSTSTGTSALVGYIGSPCETDADCPYDGGVCLREDEGFPRGTCSAPCEQFCEDADGYPTTFCTDTGELPADVAFLGDGGCLSRCDFGLYPYTGCREDYGCVPASRANEAGTETYACLPDVPSDLSSCMADLAARGVPFSSSVIADSAPAEEPSLTCHVEEPIVFASGYLGIDLRYYYDAEPGTVSGACSLGQALADTIENVSTENVTEIIHLGTYVCRTISGTSTLSRHAYGDAIDIYGFTFGTGDEYTLVDHWEHETTSFDTVEGEWLYETAYEWSDLGLWNIILTPNYNSAHDNHFHVDMTPGSDFIGLTDPRYFGPSPWENE